MKLLDKRLIAMALLAASLPGCNLDDLLGKKEDDDAAALAPAVASIHITPETAGIDSDANVQLICHALYADGSSLEVAAAWSSPSSDLVLLSEGAAGSIVVTGKGIEGTAVVEGSYAGFVATATIILGDPVPADPGPVFGAQDSSWTDHSTLLGYPPAGGAAPEAIREEYGKWYTGAVLNSAGTEVYIVENDQAFETSNDELVRVDVATGVRTPVAMFPDDTNAYIGIDRDSQGRIYAVGFGSGDVVRHDPEAGGIVPVGEAVGHITGVAVGADDSLYLTPLWTPDAASPWIVRWDSEADAVSIWGTLAPEVVAFRGGSVPAGIAVNKAGEAFVADMTAPYLFRYVDLNEDGDALDAGEQVLFADLPHNASDPWDRYTLGIAATKGGGALVNIEPDWAAENIGLYWVVDRNRNGNANDPGDQLLYNAQWTTNGNPGSITAPR